MEIKYRLCSIILASAFAPLVAQAQDQEQQAVPTGYTVDPETCDKTTTRDLINITRNRKGEVTNTDLIKTITENAGIDYDCLAVKLEHQEDSKKITVAADIVTTMLTEPSLAEDIKEFSDGMIEDIYLELMRRNKEQGVNLNLVPLENIINSNREGSVARLIASQQATATIEQTGPRSYKSKITGLAPTSLQPPSR